MSVQTWVAACMDPAEWDAWHAANRSARGGRDSRPCDDCLLGFAAEMRTAGRCNGQPGADATDDEEETAMEPTNTPAPKTTPARLTVEAPCRSCSHAPVCRVRDRVIDASTIAIAVPVMGDGVTIALTGTVECDWYVRDRGAPSERKGRKHNWSPEQRAAAAERARQMMAARKAAKEAA